MKSVCRKHENTENIDLTPMLDVVFIMLIFFVVTASFIKEQALDIRQSPESSSSNADATPTAITVTENNKVLIDNRAVEVAALRSLISQKAAALGREAGFVVNAHQLSSTEMYVAILDAAHQENIHAVSLRTYAN